LEGSKEREREKLERRVEALAGEIAALINTSRGGERNDLRDLALSIVREEVRSGEEAGDEPELERAPAKPFNTVAMGIPVFLVGAVMTVLFPPMGLLLCAVALALIGWGVAVSVFSRRGGRPRE
jgi:hypothetical protein